MIGQLRMRSAKGNLVCAETMEREGGHASTSPLTLVFCSGVGASPSRSYLGLCAGIPRDCGLVLLLLVWSSTSLCEGLVRLRVTENNILLVVWYSSQARCHLVLREKTL